METRKKNKVLRFFISIIVLCIIGEIVGYFWIVSTLSPVDENNTEQVEIDIPMGSTPSNIGDILEENHVIQNSFTFVNYAKYFNEVSFQAGTYQLSPSLDASEIVDILNDGPIAVLQYKITIPEGTSLEQISQIVEKQSGISSEEFMTTVNDTDYLLSLQSQYPSMLTDKIFQEGIRYPLEGYLYPATYEYYSKDETVDSIIQPMLKKTADVLSGYQDEMTQRNIDAHTLLTMASLVEEEATQLTDRKKIASVFYNRVEAGMPLQTDPTVLYALGEHKDRVLYSDLEVESPYNTYRIKGLPIGPISNAGEESIDAALHPEETEYYYFLADGTGNVYFSSTLDEHNALKAEHITGK